MRALANHPALVALRQRLLAGRCRKHGHDTRAKAAAQVKSIVARDLDTRPGATLRPYQCPRCLKWHVGHAPTEEGR